MSADHSPTSIEEYKRIIQEFPCTRFTYHPVNKYKAICFHVLGFKFQNPKDKLCKTQVVSKS